MGKMGKAYVVATLMLACGTAAAGEFDGYCFPPDADGVSQRIENDSWTDMEGGCSMADPVVVSGMDAILYNVTCKGDWGSRENRMFFLKIDEGKGAIAADGSGYTVLSPCI